METRLDTGRIYRSEKTDEGFLRVWFGASKVGDLVYRTDSGDRIEYVSEETLFNQESLDTAWGKPITLLHPESGLLTTENARKESRGLTQIMGDRTDSNVLTILGVLIDKEAINAVESGEAVEVSAGYTTDVVTRADGTYEQTNRRYNHFALVPKGRAGSSVRVHLDCLRCDAVTEQDLELIGKPDAQPSGEQGKQTRQIEGNPMGQIKLDGADYELDAAIIAAIRADQKNAESVLKETKQKLDEAEQTKAALQSELDQTAGELEGLKTQLEKKTDNAEQIATEVKKRLDAIYEVLPAIEAIDADYQVDFMMPVRDIRATYLKMVHDKEIKQDASEEYVNGLYEALRPDPKQTAVNKTRSHLDELNNSVRSDGKGNPLEEARKKALERKQKAYMGGAK